MFSNARQSIPKIFVEKMQVDALIDQEREASITSLIRWRDLRDRQVKIRSACEKFIQDQRERGGQK